NDPDLDSPRLGGEEREMLVDETSGRRSGHKRSTESEVPSPTRARGDRSDGGITLEAIRSLLQEQTKSLMDSHQQDLMDLKTATFKELTGIKKDVRKHGDFIEQLRDNQEKIEDRLKCLEQRGPGSAATTTSEATRPNLMILGGWPQDTQKDILLAELDTSLQQLGLQGSFEDVFCTGPRRGFAMAFVAMQPSETGMQLKRRMITLAQQIQNAGIRAPSMDATRTLKATLGKSKQERLLSNHTGKTKRLILTISPTSLGAIETEYSAGNVWFHSKLVASASRLGPHDGCLPGKPDRSWLDVVMLFKLLKMPQEDIEKQWGDLHEQGATLQRGRPRTEFLSPRYSVSEDADMASGCVNSDVTAEELRTSGLCPQADPDALRSKVDSYKQIGGDHERISFVSAKLPSLDRIDQATLQVADLYRQAKRTKSEQDWKAAHKARRKAQEAWRDNRNERAAEGHWQSFRSLKTLGGNEWTVHFIEAAEEAKQDPKRWTVQHFRTLFQKTEPRDPPRWNKEVDTGNHFTLEDLRQALQKGKTNKAVGEDLVSFELIRALCEDAPTEKAFLEWMERLRCGEQLPQSWLRTVVTLLPKSDKPRGPKDLRPISVGASAAKVFGTMLLIRTRSYVRPAGPAQCAHNGRQTADYLHAALKTFSLDTEWRLGLSWCRIDIQKAFDTLARDRTLQLLRDNLPAEMFLEYRCWERLFHEGTAVLKTPWGDEEIAQERGIRQGSVESPFLFSIAIEMALKAATEHSEWPKTIPSAPDLPLAELLYMDDTLLWAANRDDMIKKYNILKSELAKWGLRVNPEKTSYYHSPHSTTPGNIVLDDQVIEPASHMTVFGIPLATPLKPTSLMDTAMSKASKKFYANKHIFMARSPLKGKLKTFQTIVGGSALWYCSAVSPSTQALSGMNTLQLELLAKTIGFRGKTEETWLDFRSRSLRGARHVLHSHHMDRWSTIWLRRFWDYKGHVARAMHRESPPASSLMDSVRTLEWWTERQRSGIRRPGHFYPYRTNEEKALNRAAGGTPWRLAATDTARWAQCKEAWVQAMDVAWASGRQLAIGQ
ncbi:unnamed protein product, partial [Symbiodinium sp. KB8]